MLPVSNVSICGFHYDKVHRHCIKSISKNDNVALFNGKDGSVSRAEFETRPIPVISLDRDDPVGIVFEDSLTNLRFVTYRIHCLYFQNFNQQRNISNFYDYSFGFDKEFCRTVFFIYLFIPNAIHSVECVWHNHTQRLYHYH